MQSETTTPETVPAIEAVDVTPSTTDTLPVTDTIESLGSIQPETPSLWKRLKLRHYVVVGLLVLCLAGIGLTARMDAKNFVVTPAPVVSVTKKLTPSPVLSPTVIVTPTIVPTLKPVVNRVKSVTTPTRPY